jgi:hypothetical protein
MFLHVACAIRDGRVLWHWEGIKRELPMRGASALVKRQANPEKPNLLNF